MGGFLTRIIANYQLSNRIIAFTSTDLLRLKHDNVSALALRSISKACKHKGLQGEVPLAWWCCEVHSSRSPWNGGLRNSLPLELNLLCMRSEEKAGRRGGGGGLPFMVVWELEETLKPILPKGFL